MAGKYRKIDPRLWKDEIFLQLDERDKLIAIYVMTAQSNRIGLFNFSPALAAEDLNIKFETFRKRLANVCQRFHWGYDETFRVMYIPTWWKYNHPENFNVLTGNLKDIHDLPKTPLLSSFSNNLLYLEERFHQTFREGLPQRLGKRSAKQEQEQEQEQDIYTPSVSDGKKGKAESQKTAVRPDWIKDDLWKELLANRRFKKLQNTPLALSVFLPNIKKGIEAGYTVEKCIAEYVGSKWQKFNHEWISDPPERKEKGNGFDYSRIKAGESIRWNSEEYLIEEGNVLRVEGKIIPPGQLRQMFREGKIELIG